MCACRERGKKKFYLNRYLIWTKIYSYYFFYICYFLIFQLISRKRKEKLELKSRESTETVKTSEKDDIYHSRKRRALLDLLLDETIDNNCISEEEIRQEVDTFTFEVNNSFRMSSLIVALKCNLPMQFYSIK